MLLFYSMLDQIKVALVSKKSYEHQRFKRQELKRDYLKFIKHLYLWTCGQRGRSPRLSEESLAPPLNSPLLSVRM